MYWLLLFLVCSSYGNIENDIPLVTKHESLVVPYGRAAQVDPKTHLNIVVSSKYRCKVTVIRDDPLTERTGYLTPDEFPCDFVKGEVRYVHFGSRAPSKDFVKLSIRVDTATKTLLRRVVLDINVDFAPMQIVTKNTGLVVYRPGGVTKPIDSDVLRFTYNSKLGCNIKILDSEDGLPRYGNLVNATRNKRQFNRRLECSKFLSTEIRYQHNHVVKSPNRDYIPMSVEVFRENGEVLTEYFQVAVRILGARPNQRPQATFISSKQLSVDEFVTKLIGIDVLDVEDDETSSDYLILNITKPLSPGQGSIIYTDEPYNPITSFYRNDIRELKIAYRPPTASSNVEQTFEVIFEAIDTEASHSLPIILLITVRPRNTLAPTVTKNRVLQLFEGQSRIISSTENLQISDKDNIDDVKIEVIGGLKHGELYVSRKLARKFTPRDLDNGTIIYQHDNSDTYSDNLVLNATDGEQFVEFVFIINIISVDDQPPALIHNTGLQLDKGNSAIIDEFSLKAADIDSDSRKIEFYLKDVESQKPSFRCGKLRLRQREKPTDIQNWVFRNSYYVKEGVRSFTQEDVSLGKLFYVHDGEEIFEDRFHFFLADKSEKPNTSEMKTFHITINQVDIKSPEIHPECTMSAEVSEESGIKLSKEMLWYIDEDSDERELVYTVIHGPYFVPYSNASNKAGSLVLSEKPDTVVTNFTQRQLLHHRITYRPPRMFHMYEDRLVQFAFSVSDPAGHTVSQIFQIMLYTGNSRIRNIKFTELQVTEGGMIYLSQIKGNERDYLQQYFIVSPPLHGNLYKNGQLLNIGGSFTLKDIIEKRLYYIQGGRGGKPDAVRIRLLSGKETTTFQIQAASKSSDRSAPTLGKRISPKLLKVSAINVEEHGFATITDKELQAEDPDTSDLQLLFKINSFPSKGLLLVNGTISNNFTQEDVINGLVTYRHDMNEIGMNEVQDYFNLTLSDDDELDGGTHSTGFTFVVNISPVDNKEPVLKITSPISVLEGGKVLVTTKNILVTDADTRLEDITCTIDAQPMVGLLENIAPAEGTEQSREGIAINAFKAKDISLERINYVQNKHKGVESKTDMLAISCSDGLNNSLRHLITVIIQPRNDEVPKIYIRDFVVDEGKSRKLYLTIFNVVDDDIPRDKITVKLIKPPKHGILVDRSRSLTDPIDHFDFDKIKRFSKNPITYNHDGTETTRDILQFAISDGVHEVRKDVVVTIRPVDDETPRLVTNTGLYLNRMGETRMLSPRVLKADDIDSVNEKVKFIIRSLPPSGILTKYGKNGRLINMTIGMSFTQEEIDKGLIYYYDYSKIGGIRKEIRFDLTDGRNPLINQVFYIHTKPIDQIHPVVLTKGVRLRKGTSVTLSTDSITSTDANSPDENLVYYITKPPSKGIITMASQPNIPISKFTQLDLAGNNIKYVHTSSDGSNMDTFDFEVTDGTNSVMRKFVVSLLDGDNTHIVIKYSPIRVSEGESKEITSFELKAEDPDTTSQFLIYTITQIPVNGLIMKHGLQVMTFTQHDIDENLISYQHDGSDTTEDSFSFSITDGTHFDFYVYPNTHMLTRKPQTVLIHIKPVDNKSPQLILNRGGTTLENVLGGSLGISLTNNHLKAVDPDSNNTLLTYLISAAPIHGIIINVALGNTGVDMFQQKDIDKGNIYYILNKTVMNVTADRVYFDLADPGDNMLPSQIFTLNWAWISLDNTLYSVSETDRFIVVTLLRDGFLGETSFVGISAVDGSAKIQDDYVPNSANQVQFNPGERYKTWLILINDDNVYEDLEEFTVQLSSPVMAVMGEQKQAKIRITDPEDRPMVAISKSIYYTSENAGYVHVLLHRYGDTSKKNQVLCYTQSASALGTSGSRIESNSDFITRSQDKKNIIHFNKGEKEKACSIKLIDDSFYEEEEEFVVHIQSSFDTIVSKRNNKTSVRILKDKRDEPRFRFASTKYVVDENTELCKVIVERSGSDLSQEASVVVRSKRTKPLSAVAYQDYIPVSKTLYFGPHVMTQVVNIVILDDLGEPVLEGLEYFELALALPINGRIKTPDTTLIIINDTYSDLPTIQFQKSSITVYEEDVIASAILVRTGDLNRVSAVQCYTRQISAKAGVDYLERPKSEKGVVTFLAGESTQECHVKIWDDQFYEGDEKLRLVLAPAIQENGVSDSIIGTQSETVITIKDNNDRPSIGFKNQRYFINEPSNLHGSHSTVTLHVTRNGDTSKDSRIRIYTKDGSAKADLDFSPLSKMLVFEKNVTDLTVKIKILVDEEREMREAFTVHLSRDRNGVALIDNSKVIIYIEENQYKTGVTFPLIPTVVSLRDYDDVKKSPLQPVQGYPLICVTACDPKHPRYTETGSLCNRQSIDNSKTLYQWEVAAPTGSDGVTNPFRSIDSETFFASSNTVTLDSVYFGPGSRVRCTARAITYNKYKGLGSTSNPVTISRKDGLCLPQRVGDIGSEPFSAQIIYTGFEDLNYPNMIKLQVLIPHIDGMLPAISTKSLSNFEITLTADASRRGQHLCSNILDVNEVQTKSGFLTDHVKDTHVIGGTEPYQYSTLLRSNSTLRFYRNLNLESCMWTFENYYTMSELVQECGGRIATDGQVLDQTRSHLSVRVPLYVSYIYHSPSALGGWMHFDHSTQLKMSFTYSTSVLWKDGIGTPDDSALKGYLYPTSVLIRPHDKRLVVNFKTVARFRGTFITERKDKKITSMVIAPSQPNLSFKLKLLRSAQTYNSPQQMWQFVSEFSVRDYSGTYYIKLIPCTVTQNIKYSLPLKCNPRNPITFSLPIRFQQTSDPDSVEFSVGTQFYLLAREDVWLSNKTNEVMEQSDAAFSTGSPIYGRVMVNPHQSLGSAYHVSIEKVFVCSGLDDYVPQYNPDLKEFGCLADSTQLSYRFKILDRGAPHITTKKFRNVPFKALLAIDDAHAHSLVEQPNSDGFKFDSTPLFQVSSGRQWYLHTIYTIRSSHSSTRGIGKRDVENEPVHYVHSVSKREIMSKRDNQPKGATLLRSIKLNYDSVTEQEKDMDILTGDLTKGSKSGGRHSETENEESVSSIKWILVAVVTVCFILVIAVIALIMLYKRKARPIVKNTTSHGDPTEGTEV